MTAPVSTVPDEQPPVAPETPTPSLPDRADAPVSEVTERFLRAVVAEVPIELIEELHLFSPLRQGTVETGIAVLAARVPLAEVVEQGEEPELPFAEGAEAAESAEALTAEALTAEAPTAEAPTAEAGEAEAEVTGAGETETAETETAETETAETVAVASDDAPLGDDAVVIAEEQVIVAAEAMPADEVVSDEVAEVAADVSAEDADALDVVAAAGDDDEEVSPHEAEVIDASADESDEADAVSEAPAEKPAKPVRHTVYTARYRYVIKGPERGKWESNIKAEADAPLITVETVVRGVQRRAGEESEIVRYTGAQIARALRIPLPA